MNRNKIEELKRARFSIEYENMLASPTVKEINPDCKCVKIDGELSFTSAFGKSEKTIDIVLKPEDKAYFHSNCLNPDCTGFGFSLSSIIYSAIKERIVKEGVIHCEGKEDWKYYDNVGCSCMSYCKYRIEPLF